MKPSICLSLNCENLIEVENELEKYYEYADIIEFCADKYLDVEKLDDESYLELLNKVALLTKDKPIIIDYKGDFLIQERIIKLSSKVADIIDIDFDDPNRDNLINITHSNGARVLLSSHNFEKMPSVNEIAEHFLLMEKTEADIIKYACFSNSKEDTLNLLNGLSKYKLLKNTKPTVAIAMGEYGKESRVCAGEFGSVITYSCGTKETAPGQINAKELRKYIEEYYG